MKKVNIICIGSIKEKFYIEAIEEYKKRISRYAKLEIKEIKEFKIQTETESNVKIVREKESFAILNALPTGHNILLDIEGDLISSIELSQKVDQLYQTNTVINFIIGGSNGVSEELKESIKDKISFGRITFPHQLMRVVLLEQIYRQFNINSGGSYHK